MLGPAEFNFTIKGYLKINQRYVIKTTWKFLLEEIFLNYNILRVGISQLKAA